MNPMVRRWFRVAAAAGLAGVAWGAACSRAEVRQPAPPAGETDYPSGYASWKKINPEPIVREGDKVVRNLFANEAALHRDAAGRFPVGAVLVKEERSLAADPAGRLVPRDVFRVSVMFKVGKGQMDGWAFKAFDPSTGQEFPRDRVDPDGCYFCHADARDSDYVFSDVR